MKVRFVERLVDSDNLKIDSEVVVVCVPDSKSDTLRSACIFLKVRLF